MNILLKEEVQEHTVRKSQKVLTNKKLILKFGHLADLKIIQLSMSKKWNGKAHKVG